MMKFLALSVKFAFAFYFTLYACCGFANQVSIEHQKGMVQITNKSKTPLYLKNAELSFYGTEPFIIQAKDNHRLKFKVKKKKLEHMPHNAGNFFAVYLDEVTPSILPANGTLKMQLITNADEKFHGFQINLHQPVTVPVKVDVDPANWTQTIKICNNTQHEIPLKNISFRFNFNGVISSIWGSPWVSWQVASHQGAAYTLTGGTPWSQPLPADPECNRPMTIQFSSTPTSSQPSGPFTFKAEGAEVTGGGAITVHVKPVETPGLPNPTVTIQGPNFTQEKTVTWGSNWQVSNLAAGQYTVTASSVQTDTTFLEAKPVIVNVGTNDHKEATVSYAKVPTQALSIALTNAKGAVQIQFAGFKYQLSKTFTESSVVALPADTYTVTASSAGYTARITPNPVVVPTNTSVTITLEQSNLLPRFGAYFQSWSSRWSNQPGQSDLAKLPSYVNYVYLSFAKPDANYVRGSLNYQSVGLQFNYESGQFLKDAIAALHQAHPQTKVILAVGGATYNQWDQLNPEALSHFVTDFGLDGIDIDYEAPHPGCTKGQDGLIHCAIDEKFQAIVQSLRKALPRPYSLCVTAWSISAYGQDQWSQATPQGEFTGMMLPFLRSAAAKDIDYLNVMSYDASDAYNPIVATAAFNHYYAGPVYMGVEVPPEAWGGHVYTMPEVNALTKAAMNKALEKKTTPGMMLWSLQKRVNGAPSATNPSAQMMSSEICMILGLENCTDPLF